MDAALGARAEEAFAQQRVRSDTAAQHQPTSTHLLCGALRLRHQHVDHRRLERRRHVGRRDIGVLAHMIHHRRLQAAEAEVEPVVQHRPREADRLGVAVHRFTIDRRAAGVAEPEEASDLVERLAGGVVDRLPEQAVLAVVLHLDQHRVAAGDQHHDQRELQRRVFQEGRIEVGLHVVDADEWDVPRQRQRLRRRHTDEQRADQAGPDGARDRVDALFGDAGLDDRAGDHRVEQVEVGTAGDLRHDATELGVQIHLGADRAGDDVVAAHHERGGRLVAAGLDTEHERRIRDLERATVRTTERAAHRAASGQIVRRRSWYSGRAMSLHHMTIASSVFS